jgi:hypothetical protein
VVSTKRQIYYDQTILHLNKVVQLYIGYIFVPAYQTNNTLVYGFIIVGGAKENYADNLMAVKVKLSEGNT